MDKPRVQAENLHRRLAAILSADVKGYSRQMHAREEEAHRQTSAAIDAFRSLVSLHRGRIAGLAGDGFLADFPSAVSAVNCALSAQLERRTANAAASEGERTEFRVGLHLGEVIVQEDGIYGDSVNIAVRLQQISEPGGICISRAIYDQIKNRLPLDCRYGGRKQLKNIAEPVDVYHVRVGIEEAGMLAPTRRQAPYVLPLPSRPSIAVLPFQNLSGDDNQDFFSDGITEDITQGLSKFHQLFVIAWNSAFIFKGKSYSAQQVGRDLGVRYLLEGSVRRWDTRLRVAAELVQADTGRHLWAERYDRERTDIFEVQDEITQTIVGTLVGQVEEAEMNRMRYGQTDDLEAYGYFLRGREAASTLTEQGNATAREMFEKSIETDPRYARAHSALARVYHYDWQFGWNRASAEYLERAFNLAKQATTLDTSDASGYAELGFVCLFQRKHQLALAALDRALTINPNDPDAMTELSEIYVYMGRTREAAELVRSAMRLNPHYPDRYLWYLADACYALRQYDEVISAIEAMHNLGPGQRLLAASYAQLGKLDLARLHAQEIMRTHPDFTISGWMSKLPETDPHELAHLVEGLRKAGLPD